MAHIFRSCKNEVEFLKPLGMEMKWLCQVWGEGEHMSNNEKSPITSLSRFYFEFNSNSNEPKTFWKFKSSHEIATSSTMSSLEDK